jgi:hypothetical protein
MRNVRLEQERKFAEVVEGFRNAPNVSYGGQAEKRFGSSALKVNGKIFAMVSSAGEFVVKLPRQRVEALEAAHVGKKFEAGKGRPMKEWLALDQESGEEWLSLATEALHFVGGNS